MMPIGAGAGNEGIGRVLRYYQAMLVSGLPTIIYYQASVFTGIRLLALRSLVHMLGCGMPAAKIVSHTRGGGVEIGGGGVGVGGGGEGGGGGGGGAGGEHTTKWCVIEGTPKCTRRGTAVR